MQWAGWVSDQWLCSAARGQSSAPSQEIQQFSTQLSERRWGGKFSTIMLQLRGTGALLWKQTTSFFYASENVYVPMKHHRVASHSSGIQRRTEVSDVSPLEFQKRS